MELEVIISNTTDLLRVSAFDIMCIKAEGNYSTIILNDGDEHLVPFQLGQLEHLLDNQLGTEASIFIRVGRGVIVNREFLCAINLPKQLLTLRSRNGHKVAMNASKESLRQLKELIEHHVRKGGYDE